MDNLLAAVRETATALDQKFGKDIMILDISHCTVITDYFILVTGSNPNQIQAMVDAADETLLQHGIQRRAIEGLNDAEWILMDFGDVMVHIFNEETRMYYNLERIWRDGAIVEA